MIGAARAATFNALVEAGEGRSADVVIEAVAPLGGASLREAPKERLSPLAVCIAVFTRLTDAVAADRARLHAAISAT